MPTPMNREDAINTIWDAYKEIHGVRPRHMDFNVMSDEALLNTVDNLFACFKDAAQQEEDRMEEEMWIKEQEEAERKAEIQLASLEEGNRYEVMALDAGW